MPPIHVLSGCPNRVAAIIYIDSAAAIADHGLNP
jgi:hypothetical protein